MSGFSDCVAAEIVAEMARQSVRRGELARRLGWSGPTLARRLAAKASFTLAEVEQIAGILGIPVERLISPDHGVCGYCGREMWLDRLQPCCDLPEHAGQLVCQDSHDCMGVILLRLHDQEHGAEAPGATDAAMVAAVRVVLDSFDWETDDRQYALEQIEEIVKGGAR